MIIMNKKGEFGLGKLAGWLLILAFVVAIIMARGFLWKKATTYAKELVDLPSGELEELKRIRNESQAKRIAKDEAIERNCKLLEEAAGFIKKCKDNTLTIIINDDIREKHKE